MISFSANPSHFYKEHFLRIHEEGNSEMAS